MGEIGEMWKAVKEENKLAKELFGIPCKKCLREFPKAEPTIMMPQRICRRHKKPYRDYRMWKQIACELKLEQLKGGEG